MITTQIEIRINKKLLLIVIGSLMLIVLLLVILSKIAKHQETTIFSAMNDQLAHAPQLHSITERIETWTPESKSQVFEDIHKSLRVIVRDNNFISRCQIIIVYQDTYYIIRSDYYYWEEYYGYSSFSWKSLHESDETVIKALLQNEVLSENQMLSLLRVESYSHSTISSILKLNTQNYDAFVKSTYRKPKDWNVFD